MPQETTVDVLLAVAGGHQCHGLAQTGGVVLNGNVLQRYQVAVHPERKRTEGAHALSRLGYLDIGVVVPGDDGIVAVLAAYLNVSQPLWHYQLLLVDALLDVDDLVVFHEGTAYLYGLSHIAKLPRAVACHYQRVGVVVLVLGLHGSDAAHQAHHPD